MVHEVSLERQFQANLERPDVDRRSDNSTGTIAPGLAKMVSKAASRPRNKILRLAGAENREGLKSNPELV